MMIAWSDDVNESCRKSALMYATYDTMRFEVFSYEGVDLNFRLKRVDRRSSATFHS